MTAARGNGSAVGVVGVGYVGLVTATCFADLGHDVVCYDINPERIEALLAGRVPIYEPGVDALLTRNRARLTFTGTLEDVLERCRVAFVCVDTPPMQSGDADLSRVHRVVDDLPDRGQRFVLVMKSTVPVGTGGRIRAELDTRGLDHVGYVSNPEFLREGRAVADFMEPDRIVIGAFAQADADAVAALYADLDAPVVRTDVASAEMIKYASNAFLATKISFINEIANVCEEVGADVSVVATGMGLDERIGPHFLRPGIGYGGSCFPKDVHALKQLAGNSGYHFQLLTSVIEVNDLQKRRVVGKLEKHLGSLRGRRVALLGLAFKANTDDMREASSIVLAARLRAEGASVVGYDPVAAGNARAALGDGVELAGSLIEAVTGADAAVIVTEWGEFRHLASRVVREAMAAPLIVDGRNLLDPEQARAAGFAYESVGRPSDPADILRVAAERADAVP
ncbi:MAG TPA: UDP-glucose/GDP-mannose dehydrogenase family protein [Gaiellales bacterium]|jgi:UDPglucose 6-dehydrogenase|nr:UDP-glucose/GDP-mannose dehydrogenase family protein [Gaiellales bacterium]